MHNVEVNDQPASQGTHVESSRDQSSREEGGPVLTPLPTFLAPWLHFSNGDESLALPACSINVCCEIRQQSRVPAALSPTPSSSSPSPVFTHLLAPERTLSSMENPSTPASPGRPHAQSRNSPDARASRALSSHQPSPRSPTPRLKPGPQTLHPPGAIPVQASRWRSGAPFPGEGPDSRPLARPSRCFPSFPAETGRDSVTSS